MAISDVSICNLGLQKLGAARITALNEDSRNGRSCNACYEAMRDLELRAHPWTFATSRATLAPAANAPAFEFQYAFPLPNDYLRLILPRRTLLDWKVERQDGVLVILTNDTDALQIKYIARITDPAQFDPVFADMLGTRMAMQMCEEITQSNEKKTDIEAQYKQAIGNARRCNAFEKVSDGTPVDTWLLARNVGSLPWQESEF